MGPLCARSFATLCFSGVLLLAPLLQRASAQEKPPPAVELAAGALLFSDDAVVTEGFVGGSGRVYLTQRVSVGPEIAYVSGDNHSHVILTGNVTFDLVHPAGGRPGVVTPFVTLGAGLFRTREVFPDIETFTSTEGAFTAGGGVRTLIGSRVIVGAEARVGWELHIRLNALIGVQFGR
jgi:hypothetical protein